MGITAQIAGFNASTAMVGIHMHCVDPERQVWTADGRLDRILAVRDGGARFDMDRDVADLAALRDAKIAPGHVVTCVALGLVRLGCRPFLPVTLDAEAAGGSRHRHRLDQVAGCALGTPWFAEMCSAGLIKDVRAVA
jgi:hypothetical protein